jgi:hypothetical protein
MAEAMREAREGTLHIGIVVTPEKRGDAIRFAEEQLGFSSDITGVVETEEHDFPVVILVNDTHTARCDTPYQVPAFIRPVRQIGIMNNEAAVMIGEITDPFPQEIRANVADLSNKQRRKLVPDLETRSKKHKGSNSPSRRDEYERKRRQVVLAGQEF